MTPKEKAAPAKEPLHIQTQPKDSTKQAAAKLFGAVILRPHLAACIPLAIHTQLSCYGLFLIKTCSAGWGIEGIRRALDSFGLDGVDIIDTALSAVHGDPVNIFWKSARNLCEKVAL